MKNIAINHPLFLFAAFLGLLTITSGALSDEQTHPDGPPQITEITLERTACYGPCPVDKITLSADGTASFRGKYLAGRTGDFTGKVKGRDFARLSEWLESENFFELKDRHGVPNIDTPDIIITAVKSRLRKTLVNHGFEILKIWGMKQAILGIASSIRWQPVKSGIRGSYLYQSKTPSNSHPIPAYMLITTPDQKDSFRFSADKSGKFQIPLLPGTYFIRRIISNDTRKVVVEPDEYTDVNFVIHEKEK